MSETARLKALVQPVALGELVASRAGKTPARKKKAYWHGEVPWVTAKDLKTLRLSSSQETISTLAVHDGAPIAQPGDILILVRGMTLLKDVPIGIVETPMSFNQDIRCLSPRGSIFGDISSDYLAYVLLASRDRLAACVTQAGHGTGRLAIDQLLSMPVPVPPIQIQEWLVDRIKPIERAISLLGELIAAKRDFKRGLMQELLTGRRRFPEFASWPWIEARLGDLFSERLETRFEHLPLLAVTGDRGVVLRDELDRRDTSSADKSRYKRVCPGDIAYNTMRMWQGVSGLSKYEGIVSPAYTVVTPTGPMMGRYARHLFKLPRIVHSFWRHSQGLVDDTLSLKFPRFATIRVAYPSSLDEQERIAGALDAIDREMELLMRMRTAYDQQRRGLMQNLLTGEVTVPVSSEPEPVHA